METQPFDRSHPLLFADLIMMVDLSQGFKDMLTLLWEAGHGVDEVPPRMDQAVGQHDAEALRHIAGEGVTHLDGRVPIRGSFLQDGGRTSKYNCYPSRLYLCSLISSAPLLSAILIAGCARRKLSDNTELTGACHLASCAAISYGRCVAYSSNSLRIIF